jgi:hypothetical protein
MMIDHALRLRAQGYSVIPVQGKIPCLPWLEYQSRHATADEIQAWYLQWPEAGVGVVTGAISQLVVLDIDVKGTGRTISDPVGWVYGHSLPATMAVQTASGGLHLYYAHPGGRVPNQARCATIDGFPVDVRGDGGFVVAPPSPGYRLLPHWHGVVPWPGVPGQRPVATLEGLDAISVGTADDLFAPAPEGQRNHAAAKLAGYLLKVSDEQAAWVQLRQWNTRNVPPLDERELERTFQSIARREAMKPSDGSAREVLMQGPAFDVRESGTPKPSLDILNGAAWADAVEFAPERDGLRLQTLPLADSFKGFCPGDLALLAARPGTGKSTLVWGMAWELAVEQGIPTLLCSGEMSPADVARWMTHFRTGLGYITPDTWRETLDLLRKAPIAILNRGIFTPSMVVEAMDQTSPQFVVIDHIQRMRLAKSESRNQELEQCAAELKGIAMQRSAVVFALCQLNRMADNIEHPTIAHLRDSGGLEQEADTVLGLSHVGDRLQQDPMKATVRLATLKSRHGPENVEQIAWFHKTTKRFEWLSNDVDWRRVQ